MTINPVPRIAVDAMGGDTAPTEQTKGAIKAAREQEMEICLVGDEKIIQKELGKFDTRGLSIAIVPSEGVIQENEPPARSLLAKPRSSISVAIGLVKEGKADAVVTMGSTGAAMAASTLALGLFPGLERPALGGPFVGLAPKTTIMDIGTQIDCRPSQLLSFAALGCAFSRLLLNIPDPRVGLLSIGSEEGKGNRQVKGAYKLLKESGLNFAGNVEGHDLFLDKADVVVCDGFVGNILLKFTEGISKAAAHYLSASMGPESSAVKQLQNLASVPDWAGGPLLGVNGVIIIGHGRSKAEGISNSIIRAKESLNLRLVDVMKEELGSVLRNTGIVGK